MKKYLSVLLFIMIFFSSCTRTAITTELEPAEIIEKTYGLIDEDSAASEYIPMLVTNDLNEENDEYYLGISGINYIAGAASEAYIQPVTYSFTVIRLMDTNGADSERKKIESNINKSKWVCASAQEAYVVRYGDIIAVIMGQKDVCDEIEAAFLSVVRG